MKLPRTLTLTDHADFQAVREQGQSASGKHLVLAILPNPTAIPFRYALITSKKAGKAHDRTRIRRLIRATLVEIGDQIVPGHHLIFIARWRAKKALHHEIKRDIINLTRKLGVRKD